MTGAVYHFDRLKWAYEITLPDFRFGASMKPAISAHGNSGGRPDRGEQPGTGDNQFVAHGNDFTISFAADLLLAGLP